jgi:hypothetical protein
MTAGLPEGMQTSAVDEQHARAEYYRRQSLRLQELAEKTRFPEIRIQLIVLALRYECMAARVERRRIWGQSPTDWVATGDRP